MSPSDFLWFLVIGLAIFTYWAWNAENDRLKETGNKISLISFIKIKTTLFITNIIDLKISHWFLVSAIILIVFSVGLATFVFMFRYDYPTVMNQIYKVDRITGDTYILQSISENDRIFGPVTRGYQHRWIQLTPKTSKDFR
jgi:hypothetical protein